MANHNEDNTVKIFSSTHPPGSENPVPESEKLVELLLRVIEECWQILEAHSDNKQQFSAYTTIAMTLATQRFLQNKSFRGVKSKTPRRSGALRIAWMCEAKGKKYS